MSNITQTEARRLYLAGNSTGYAPYTDVPGADTVDAAVEAAEADGWEIVLRGQSSDEVTVLENDEGDVMAIGDSNGPWAVIISGQVSS